MRIIALIFALLVSHAAVAEGALTTALRAAVVADDPAQAEALISAAHKTSLASHDTTAIYVAYRRIFGSTDPARADFIDHWIAAYPQSAYAQTALAEQLYLTALAYRRPDLNSWADPLSVKKYQQYLTLARNAAQRAMVVDRSFSRATDIWLLVLPYGVDPEAVADLAHKTMLVAPNRRTAIIAANAFHNYFPENDNWLFESCAALAPMVPDFAADTCAIAAIFTYQSVTDVAELAAKALDANDDPDLAEARIKSIVWHQRASQYTVDEAITMQVGLLETAPDLGKWLTHAQYIGSSYPDSFFDADAIDLVSKELTARLMDDPRNPTLILMRFNFQDYLDTGTARLPDLGPGGDMALWQDGLRYGYLTQSYWLTGSALLAENGQGPASHLPYLENAVVTSNGEPRSLSFFIEALAAIRGLSRTETEDPNLPHPEPDKANFAAAECPLLRASRLLLATCLINNHLVDPECSEAFGPLMQAKVAVQMANAGDLCPALATTPLRELVYKDMVPVPGFTPPADGQ
jgi:hypothetical protein